MKYKNTIIIIIILVILIGIIGYLQKDKELPAENLTPQSTNTDNNDNNNESKTPPTFTWRYEEADSFNPDGNHNTNVFLDAQYSLDVTESKLIETSPGSCNALPEKDADTFAGTKNIQCYYAGLGYVFKIVKGENSYLVQKKTFEEGTPQYNPPKQEFKTVAEFPLYK